MCLLHVLVHLREQRLCGIGQFFFCRFQFVDLAVVHLLVFRLFQNILNCLQVCLYVCLIGSVNLIAHFPQGLLCLEYEGIRFVPGVDGFFPLLILCLVLSRFLDSSIDLVVGHIGTCRDGDVLFLTRSQIFRGNVHDTVSIDIEGNFDLRHTAHCRRDTVQSELAEGLVVFRKLSLTLHHVDVNRCLVVCRCGEDLALLGRDRRISLDQSGSYAAHGLDGQRQRCHVQKQDLACTRVACQLTALDRCTQRHTLVRVQGLAGFFACQHSYLLLYRRDTCGTAYQQYLTDIGIGQTSILHRILYRDSCLLNQIMCQFVKFRPCKVHVKVLRALSRSRDERQVDIGRRRGRKLLLRLLSRLFQSLQRHLVTRQIHAFLCLELS